MNFFTFVFFVGIFLNPLDISVNVIMVAYLSTFCVSYWLIKEPQDIEEKKPWVWYQASH